ncbi:MAG: hypothetical protein JXP34_05120 [Planctomycetes bacterium]|nr:hypothetical protein [Planctomycetota bacterium]
MSLVVFLVSSLLAADAVPGDAEFFDAVPFGQRVRWERDGRDQGVVWEDARDVVRVVVTFADGATPPDPATIRVQYWQSSWPGRRIPRDRPSGGGGSGWLDIGDWFKGTWRDADVKLEAEGQRWTFLFEPIDRREFPKLKGFPATYRTTLKLRLLGQERLPAIASFAAYTDTVLEPMAFDVQWGGTSKDAEEIWDGRLEVYNGAIDSIEALDERTRAAVPPQTPGDLRAGWRSRVEGGFPGMSGIRARIRRAKPKVYFSFDQTIVTIRAAREEATFSFSATDLAKHGHIFLPDFGAIVRLSDRRIDYDDAERDWRLVRGDVARTDLYTRVAMLPEQTFARAWSDTPAKGQHYIPLSFEGCNQHFGLDEHGTAWTRKGVRLSFGFPPVQARHRTIVDGDLPMMIQEWERAGVVYRQTAFVAPLAGIPAPGERLRAEAPLVLLARIEMEKLGGGEADARLTIGYEGGEGPIALALREDLAIATAETPPRSPLRIVSPEAPERYTLTEKDGRLTYAARIAAEERTRTIDVFVPQLPLGDGADLGRLRTMAFDDLFAAVRAYWRARVAAGTRIRTPEPMIDDFYRAHVSHLLINTERERGGSDRYMARVGTFSYGVFPDESVMMISDLDRRGYHDVAERALETWVHYQGTVGLPGDFASLEGQLYGAGGYEMGGYNKSHGWILWGLGEHYFYTRDAAWLRRVAPAIVAGCDWVIRERRRMTVESERNPIRAIERGLLPAGSLEDIGDWRSWLVTNLCTWWGMRHAARALDAIGHGEAKRLLAEADAYHADLMAAVTESMRRSPVVRLRDGSWIPHVPSDFHRRGRSFGWLTETLEGAIHLLICEAIDVRSRLATWIIRDYEDNLYLSESFGYDLRGEEFDRRWFSHGGISQQANLLNNPVPYLWRDEPKHFLRATFNAFAVSYFPDTRMMTEHALPNIGDWRGDHYKASDEANSTYWLRLAFIAERGDELWLGAAIPRYWLADGQEIGIERAATHFGPMSMRMVSSVAQGWIEMSIDPPRRNPPARIRARFRHPEGLRMDRVEVNGRACDTFDPETEWVTLPPPSDPTRIRAHYGSR